MTVKGVGREEGEKEGKGGKRNELRRVRKGGETTAKTEVLGREGKRSGEGGKGEERGREGWRSENR